MRNGHRSVPALLALMFTASLTLGQSWTAEYGIVIQGDIVTMNEALDVIEDGRLVIRDNKILALLGPDDDLPDGFDPDAAVTVVTDGWVFPGLIDAHNHVAYNYLPLYEAPRKYDNRYQWSGPKSYMQHVKQPHNLVKQTKYYDLLTEGIKYAEVKALTGGVTSIQGTPDRKVTRYLVRNVENGPFGEDRVSQYGLAITAGRWDPDNVRRQMEQDLIDAWIIHLAEGTDDKSRAEFEHLKKLDLLTDKTVGIHCTALTRDQLRQMAQAGAKVIWSPTSNLLLYGQTADIPAALAEDVLVSLGADWSPSGCKNLLGELKIADKVDKLRFGDIISDTLLVQMVTSNPAFALGFDDEAGQLKPGYFADVAVYSKRNSDPYRSLIDCNERDVELVVINGEPLYGSVENMQKLKPGDFEVLDAGGRQKGLDITNPDVDEGTQTFADIRVSLEQALRADREHMYETFGDDLSREQFDSSLDSWFKDSLIPVRLDPVFAFGDSDFFRRLNTSANAGFGFDVADFWSVSGTSDPWQSVLSFVNSADATFDVLDIEVGLDRRAAQNIVDHREGPDGPFDALGELDAVPYVGQSALGKLLAFVKETGGPDARLLQFVNSADATFEVLDEAAGLRSNAARSIVDHHDGPDGIYGTADDDPFDSVAELDAVKYVGDDALGKLRAYVGD